MNVRILLPFGTFLEPTAVARIVATGNGGSFGILPQRLDCVAALVAGILTYDLPGGARCFVAVDAGTLVKTGDEVVVAVRHASGSTDLATVTAQLVSDARRFADEQQQERHASARLDQDVMRRLMELTHGR